MTSKDFPTDPNAETVGLPSDDSGKGSVPEPGKFVTQGMPSEIGRFRILGIIASGGMGVVYEAMQEAPRRRVALKVIKAGAASDMALHRFHFEAQTLAKLSHPNIAQIYEAGTWESEGGEVPFFAMEYIPGARSVVSFAEKKDLSLEKRLELFASICEAVHHGHQKGVIHRDLKPDNILIDSNGDPKIIDFGVARATDADLTVTTMQTTMGQLIGTLQYMSPEQCDADPDRIDTRSDVYALGVILFQLLSGKLPYDLRRQAIHEAVRIIKDERPTSMGTLDTSLRGDVDTIALKALEKDRDRRYQSAAELAGDIHHFLNNEPIIARPLSIGYQVHLFTKKYKRTCAAVLLLAISVFLGLLGTTWGMVEANRQEKIAVAQRVIAEDRYETILDMSRNFIGGFYEGIVKLNAALGVRKHVLDSTLLHLDDLEQTAGETDEILAEKARTNSHIGDLFAGTSAANLGDIFQSHTRHTEALNMYLQLVNGGEKKYNYNVSAEYASLANLAMLDGKHADATEIIQRSRSAMDQFLKDYPNDKNGLRLSDRLQMRLLDIYIELDQEEEIRALLEELKEVRSQRMLAAPSDLRLKRGYANILLRVGRVYLAREDFKTSLQTYQEACLHFEELVAAEPENGRALRDLAWAQYFLGEGLVLAGDIPKGFDALEAGLSLVRDRCVAFPTAEDARNDVSTYLDSYIEFCKKYKQNSRGKSMTYTVVLALQPVVESNPTNYALSEVYAKAEKIHKKMSQLATVE